jgi:hypothetical protein
LFPFGNRLRRVFANTADLEELRFGRGEYGRRFAKVFEKLPRAQVMVSSTFQAYNALSYVKLLELCDSLSLPLYAHPVQNPAHLAARVLPPTARAEAARRLRAYFAAREHRVLQVATDALIPTLEDGGRPWDLDLAATFMAFTNDLDETRGQSFPRLEPEVIECFARDGLPWDPGTRFARP